MSWKGTEVQQMGTIDQPKPSEPKSPQPDQQPLQPGGPQTSRSNTANPARPNIQTPDDNRRDRDRE
ncbi:MAG TPA: hypothetical protein VFL80_04625 [Thermoanaerobaculia bacterium]|nr:hypothetical protein [Thermoanaerobaculia bacterium]